MGGFTAQELLADELMAMAGIVGAATSENAAATLREAAYQLRISGDLLSACKAVLAQQRTDDRSIVYSPDLVAKVKAALSRATPDTLMGEDGRG